MRIISGKYRGRKLLSPNSDAIRPTTDKIKESIFNILQWEIRDSRVLDLFAGSGALGIEAISRGAGYVLFSDNARESVLLIEKNLQKIEYVGQLVKRDFRQTLDYVSKPFDIIFIDPPYDTKHGIEAVKIILERKLLTENGVIVFEHRVATPLDEITERDDLDVDVRRYGLTTSVLFIRWHSDEENEKGEEDADEAQNEQGEKMDEIPTENEALTEDGDE